MPHYWIDVFAPANLPNVVLCVIGIAGVVVAVCTLKTIARQTKATEDSVQAMEDSVQIVLSKERARIEASVAEHRWVNDPRSIVLSPTSTPFVMFRLRNVGPSHAFNVRMMAGYSLTDSEDITAFSGQLNQVDIGMTLRATDKDWKVTIHPVLKDSDVSDLQHATKFMQVAAKIVYTDVFGGERETRLRAICARVDYRERWVLHGEPRDNEST